MDNNKRSTLHSFLPVQPRSRRASPNEEGTVAKKIRASRPKVKSGCLTCKVGCLGHVYDYCACSTNSPEYR